MGICEKIYEAITINPAARAIRRISHRPQDPMPAISSQGTSLPNHILSTKPLNAQTKPAALEQRWTGKGSHHLETSKNSKAAEVVPVEFDPSIKKEKPTVLNIPIQKSSEAGKAAQKFEALSHIGLAKEDKPKPNGKTQSIRPGKTVEGKGHDQVAVKFVPNIEVLPPRVSVLEKPKPKADTAQPEKAAMSGRRHVATGTSTIEPKSSHILFQEKPKAKADTPPTKVVVKQSHGQGAKVALKVEPPKPRIPGKEDKPKSKVEMASPAKAVVEEGKLDVHGEEGKNSGRDNSTDQFSDYIKRAGMKIRATSNVVGAQEDNFNEKVSDFINRAMIKLRNTSNVGGGKKTE